MTFQIWMAGGGSAVLTRTLTVHDRQQLEQQGFYHHADIKADSPTDAQDSFTCWCRERIPNATEELVDETEMRDALDRMKA